MLLHSLILILYSLSFSFLASAQDIVPISSRARGLGMGNAQFSFVNNVDSLFFNPAGLARSNGLTWTIVGAGVGTGADVIDKIDTLEKFSDEDEFAELIRDFYGDKIFVNASGLTALTFPYFSLAVYNQTYASLSINNPVYPEINTRFINDYGYAAGLGIPISSVFHVGVAFKRIKRSGVETTYRASSLTDLDPEALVSDFTQHGIGYAMDLGANIVLDAPVVDVIFSGVWQNVGDTKFRSDNGSRIPTAKSTMGLGAGLNIDLPLINISPAIDITHLDRSDIQLMKKINFGVEVGLPLIDLRAGFHQGYYTAGLGVGLGPLHVDAATYGVELGDYPGQLEDRRYMVEFSLELGIGSLPFGGISSSGSTNRSSVWGGRRLKQRR